MGFPGKLPPGTTAAVTQALLLLAALLPSHCQAALCFSTGLQNSDVQPKGRRRRRNEDGSLPALTTGAEGKFND